MTGVGYLTPPRRSPATRDCRTPGSRPVRASPQDHAYAPGPALATGWPSPPAGPRPRLALATGWPSPLAGPRHWPALATGRPSPLAGPRHWPSPPLSRMPREPHAPAPHPGTAVLPAAVTTTMEHRSCPSGINAPSLLLSPGVPGRPTDACGVIEGLTRAPEEQSDSLQGTGQHPHLRRRPRHDLNGNTGPQTVTEGTDALQAEPTLGIPRVRCVQAPAARSTSSWAPR